MPLLIRRRELSRPTADQKEGAFETQTNWIFDELGPSPDLQEPSLLSVFVVLADSVADLALRRVFIHIKNHSCREILADPDATRSHSQSQEKNTATGASF